MSDSLDFLKNKNTLLKAAVEAGTYAAEKGYNPFFSWKSMIPVFRVGKNQMYYRYHLVVRRKFIQAYNRKQSLVA